VPDPDGSFLPGVYTAFTTPGLEILGTVDGYLPGPPLVSGLVSAGNFKIACSKMPAVHSGELAVVSEGGAAFALGTTNPGVIVATLFDTDGNLAGAKVISEAGWDLKMNKMVKVVRGGAGTPIVFESEGGSASDKLVTLTNTGLDLTTLTFAGGGRVTLDGLIGDDTIVDDTESFKSVAVVNAGGPFTANVAKAGAATLTFGVDATPGTSIMMGSTTLSRARP